MNRRQLLDKNGGWKRYRPHIAHWGKANGQLDRNGYEFQVIRYVTGKAMVADTIRSNFVGLF